MKLFALEWLNKNGAQMKRPLFSDRLHRSSRAAVAHRNTMRNMGVPCRIRTLALLPAEGE